ncbi:MAG: thiamine-phosphate kinase [Candidatus Pristimantibacillus lignocellulolyticus]|uniref:Thiamine-monophosphate kinase n=1 Tax=Candidatus Pristimantibacillus lignocellulolyticus TaxID=2994561 RepID=A0A9J6ZKG5_9BACL|nr:MAG: thiamine-phosphate kinase [Candidatus Pristimantibacillus lignocellulolyticus]
MDEFSRILYWNKQRQDQSLKESLGVIVDIGDDAAVVSLPDQVESKQKQYETLYTVDTMVEEIHFSSATTDYEHIGYKALASNLSDIAAMGGIPLHALIAISVPSHYSSDHINRIYNGIYECANRYKVAIVGGDTTSSPHSLTISITVIGIVESKKAILRSGAKAGDIVFVTGVPGQSAAGLHVLQHADKSQYQKSIVEPLIRAHQLPEPHLLAGRLLNASNECHALNDISDGLISELAEIAKASHVDITIDENQIPLSEHMSQYAALSRQPLFDWVLYGGEDYILVGTAAKEHFSSIQASFHEQQLQLYAIGVVEQGNGAVWIESWNDQQQLKARNQIVNRGYNHFK